MATIKQKILFTRISENIRNPQPDFTLGKTILEVGYSQRVSEKPKLVTESKGFRELMEANGLDDQSLTRLHNDLLQSARLDHMVFPLGPKKHESPEDDEMLSDTDIKEMLAELKCVVRRVVHGETARHVYFWSPNDKIRKDALDMGYKLKGHYAPEKKTILSAHVVMDDRKRKIAEKYEEELRKTLME